MMAIEFENKHVIAIAVGMILVALDFIKFKNSPIFVPFLAIAFIAGTLPWWIDFFSKRKKQREYEGDFLEFVRNLTGAIKSGMPVSRAVIHVSDSDYGSLSEHVKKLARQLEWAIPFHRALVNFANGTKNPVIRRAVATVIEAEQAGGNIEDVLTSITESLVEIKRIAEQRRASIHGQVIQSYVIFFVFLGVMIVIQNLLIPYISGLEGGAGGGLEANADSLLQAKVVKVQQTVEIDFSSFGAFTNSMSNWFVTLHGVFLMLTMIQGLFAGLIIGKLSEGLIASGIKHSLVLMTVGFLVITLAQGF